MVKKEQPQQGLQLLKNFVQNECPHCKKKIIIKQLFTNPILTQAVRPEDLLEMKNKLKKLIEEKEFEQEREKKQLLEWLGREDTVVDQEDYMALAKQLENQKAKAVPKIEKE